MLKPLENLGSAGSWGNAVDEDAWLADNPATVADRNADAMRTDLHLLCRWAWRAVTDPRIVDPVASLLGPNVLL